MDARYRSRPDTSFPADIGPVWHVERSTAPGQWSLVGTIAHLPGWPGAWYVSLPEPPEGHPHRWFTSREEATAYVLWKGRTEAPPCEARRLHVLPAVPLPDPVRAASPRKGVLGTIHRFLALLGVGPRAAG